MATLPRELLKWLQSLDLSLPVKNVKRDLSNGYIVAEILARYWAEVSLHSFDNGCALMAKTDNWAQLEKICRKREVTLPADLIDGVIHQRPDCAMTMIATIYAALTGRTLALPAPTPGPTAAGPSYALPTAGQLLREAHPEGHHVERQITRDREAVQRQNAAVLARHAELLRAAKAAHPQHYKPQPRPTLLDRSRPSGRAPAVSDTHPITVKNCPKLPRSRLLPSGAGAPDSPGLLRLLSALCRPLLPDDFLSTDSPDEAAAQFVQRLKDVSPAAARAVWSAWQGATGLLAETLVQSPDDLKAVVTLLQPLLLESAPEAPDTAAAIELLALTGRALARQAPGLAVLGCRTALLPALRPALARGSPAPRRGAALSVIHAFAAAGPPTLRIEALEGLRECLATPDSFSAPRDAGAGDPVPFLLCLAGLVAMESVPAGAVVDFYVAHARRGVHGSSPTGRAAALAILSTIAGRGGATRVTELLPQLQASAASASGEPWETEVQRVLLCNVLLDQALQQADGAGAGPLQAQVMELLKMSFGPELSLPARRVGLAALAHHVARDVAAGWDFAERYMDVLLSLPASTRIPLLAGDGPIPTVPGALRDYRLVRPPAEWDPLTAAQGLMGAVARRRQRRALLPTAQLRAVLEVLALGVLAWPQLDPAGNVDDWRQVLSGVGDDLAEALRHESLLDDEMRELVLNVVSKFYLELMAIMPTDEELDTLQERAAEWFAGWPNI